MLLHWRLTISPLLQELSSTGKREIFGRCLDLTVLLTTKSYRRSSEHEHPRLAALLRRPQLQRPVPARGRGASNFFPVAPEGSSSPAPGSYPPAQRGQAHLPAGQEASPGGLPEPWCVRHHHTCRAHPSSGDEAHGPH